tara:strand:+ start:2415 stop:2669 length:255 start_codon:yes stop_codon:yes gene_type:complete
MQDFEEMAQLAGEVRKFYPQEPELAMRHFEASYTRLISGLILGMAWNYLEAEHILFTGERTDPLQSARKWEAKDFTQFSRNHKN